MDLSICACFVASLASFACLNKLAHFSFLTSKHNKPNTTAKKTCFFHLKKFVFSSVVLPARTLVAEPLSKCSPCPCVIFVYIFVGSIQVVFVVVVARCCCVVSRHGLHFDGLSDQSPRRQGTKTV